MFSGVIAWFYRGLLGICPREDAPGFEQIDLRPCFVAGLGFVRGSMQTVRGEIEVEWHEADGGFVYTVTIPQGVSAVWRGDVLTGGTYQFQVSKN